MENLRTMMTEIDEVKPFIKEGKYLKLVDNLNNANKVFSNLYKFTYLHQKKQYDYGNCNEPATYKLIPIKKIQIVKISKHHFANIEIDEHEQDKRLKQFIKDVNEFNFVGVHKNYDNISLSIKNNSIPTIIINSQNIENFRNFKLEEEIKGERDYDEEMDDMYIEINDIIPLHIEEIN